MKTRNGHFFTLLLIASLLLNGCYGDHVSTMQGDNNVVYSNNYMYPIKFEPSKYGNRIYVDNVDIYAQALGQTAYSSNGSLTDGKPDWSKEIIISNIHLTSNLEVKLSGGGMSNNLLDAKLIYAYYPINNSGKKEIVLATYASYNASDSKINFDVFDRNLTSTLKENYGSGEMYFTFKFANSKDDNAYLTYTIPFNYQYSFKQKQAKNKE